ncbi:Xaa-Pro aminopeptidase [Morganella morganii]|nr:Xaa-Pro aminopeptidase [Morganella morganii]
MAYADTIVFNALDTLRRGSRRNLSAPGTIIDWRPIVHEMRLFKSPAELDIMRRAGKVSALATHPCDGKMPSGYVRISVTGRD